MEANNAAAAPSLDTALQAALTAGQAMARATVWPIVIVTTYVIQRADIGPRVEDVHNVVWAAYGDAPAPEDFTPAGAEFLRGEIVPAVRLEEMPWVIRGSHTAKFRAYLMARRARALGLSVADMVALGHYDAALIDETVSRWARGML